MLLMRLRHIGSDRDGERDRDREGVSKTEIKQEYKSIRIAESLMLQLEDLPLAINSHNSWSQFPTRKQLLPVGSD